MSERRRHPRMAARLVLGIETESRSDRAGLTRDVSCTGMVFRSPSRFAVGETLRVKFRHPQSESQTVEATGRVVRTHSEPARYFFRHVAAICFDQPIEALGAL